MNRVYHTHTSFLDLLFNTLLAFAAMFAIAFMMIKQENKNKNVEAKAEFIITVTWGIEIDDDVDTYVEDPNGNLVCFRRREDGLMHLDRDDLGYRGDRIYTYTGEVVEYKENREIVTIRGIVPGEYVVNVHMYHKNSTEATTPVRITLEKINPNLSLVKLKEVELGDVGSEKTAFRFTLDSEGGIVETNELEKSLTTIRNPGSGEFE